MSRIPYDLEDAYHYIQSSLSRKDKLLAAYAAVWMGIYLWDEYFDPSQDPRVEILKVDEAIRDVANQVYLALKFNRPPDINLEDIKTLELFADPKFGFVAPGTDYPFTDLFEAIIELVYAFGAQDLSEKVYGILEIVYYIYLFSPYRSRGMEGFFRSWYDLFLVMREDDVRNPSFLWT